MAAIHAQQLLAEFGQLAGRVDAADQRAAGGARHRDHVEAARLERLDHADLGEAARTAGAQDQRDLFTTVDRGGLAFGAGFDHGSQARAQRS